MSKNTKSRFICNSCQNPKQNSANEPSNNFDSKLEEIIRSISFMGRQFDEFNKKLDTTLKEMKLLRTENDTIKAENMRLANEVLNIKQKLDTLEQTNLGISIEISGIPNTANENCTDIIKEIAKKLDITVNILEATRMTQSENKPSIIIAKLETLEMRIHMIKTARAKKLNANMICNSWKINNKIYINERLTRQKNPLR